MPFRRFKVTEVEFEPGGRPDAEQRHRSLADLTVLSKLAGQENHQRRLADELTPVPWCLQRFSDSCFEDSPATPLLEVKSPDVRPPPFGKLDLGAWLARGIA